MTFPLAVMDFGFGFLKTIVLTNIGGIAGILFFTYLSEGIIKIWRRFVQGNRKPENHIKYIGLKKRKIFNHRNRRIVKIKTKYGLAGIAVLTPLLLSIPVGVFLALRYFRSVKMRFAYLALSNFIWSIIYTVFYMFCYDVYIYGYTT